MRDMPAAVTHVALLENGELREKYHRKDLKNAMQRPKKNRFPSLNATALEAMSRSILVMMNFLLR